MKDHLGNNRIVMDASGAVKQATNYYPSGTTMAERQTDQGVQPYKYNAKELDRTNGLDFYDYEARMYDPVLMRFTTIDPMAEKYYSVSPYAYCNNNPVNRIDPSGLDSYMVFYSTSDARFKAAAETRQREIESQKEFNSKKDHVYMVEIGDLGTLGDRVSGMVQDATDNRYGMTVEASFYTHGAVDGPVGDVSTTGEYNLKNETGLAFDDKQLSTTGWSNINWNFDPNNSVAAFYGCRTAGFAERFFDYSNVQYTAGQGGRVGPSSSTDDFSPVGYFSRVFGTSSNVFYGDNIMLLPPN
jgi:RHS repeat-associated protein